MIFNAAWARELDALETLVPGGYADTISEALGRAYREELSHASGGQGAAKVVRALMPLMWRSLLDRPEAALLATRVFDDAGRAEGILVQLGLASARSPGETRGAVGLQDRTAFVLRLGDALRRLDDPAEIQALGTRMLGEVLLADRANLSEVDLEARLAWQRTEYRRDGVEAVEPRTLVLDDLGPAIASLRQGIPLVIADLHAAEDDATDGIAAEVLRYAVGSHRAQLSVPIVRLGALVAVMTVRRDRPHDWTAEEIAIAHETAVRVWEAVERARAEAGLRLSEARHRALFESVDEGVCLFERLPRRPDGLNDYRYVAMNPAMQAMFGIPDLTGQSIRENFPDEVEAWYDDYDRVLETGEPIRMVRESEPQGMVLDMFVTRVEDATGRMLLAVMQDVTTRVRAEEVLRREGVRKAFLLRLADALRPLDDPAAIEEVTTRMLGEHFGVGRCVYAEFRMEAGQEIVVIEREYRAPDAQILLGRHPADRFEPDVTSLRAGQAIAVDDCETESGSEAEKARWRSLGVRAWMVVPLVGGGRLLAGLELHDSAPRSWTDDEIALVTEVGERTWAAVERARAEAAVRESERHLRAEEARKAFLLKVSDTLRPLGDAERLLLEATRMIGEHFGVAHANFATIEREGDVEYYVARHSYAAPGRHSVDGRYRLADFPGVTDELHKGKTMVVREVAADPVLSDRDKASCAEFGVASFVMAPLVKRGRLVATFAAQDPAPRDWDDLEISLLEDVAERIWSAVERVRAETALRESELRLRNVLDGMGEAFGLMDHELRIITQNKAALALDGRSLDEIRGRSHWEIYPGTEESEIGRLYKRALAEQVPVSLEHRYTWDEGRENWLDMRAFPVPEGLAVFWRDITERKESEAALRTSEAKFRGLFEVMSEGYVLAEVIHDDAGRPVDALCLEGNPSAARLAGVPDFTGRVLSEAMPGFEQRPLEIYDRVLRTGVAERLEQFASGSGRWYDVSVSPVEAGAEDMSAPRRLAIVFTDITERKRAERVLRESEGLKTVLLELSDVLRELSDPAELQMASCRVLREHLGAAAAQYGELDFERQVIRIVSDHSHGAMPSHVGEYPMRLFPAHMAAWMSGRAIAVDDVAADRDLSEGERSWFLAESFGAALIVPIVKRGNVFAVMSVLDTRPRAWTAEDRALVQETAGRTWEALKRIRAEEDLRESEERFRALVTATSFAVFRMSPDWREMRALGGGGFLQDTPGTTTNWLDAYVHEDDRDEVMAAIGRAIESKCVFELEHRVRRRDGTLGWTLSRGVPLMNASGEIVEWFATASDVTTRRAAEETARQAELRLRLAQDAAGVATFDWLIEAHEWQWSPEMAEMLGMQEGVLGGSYEDWMALIHPDDLDTAIRSVEEAMETGIFEGEWRVVRPDGVHLHVLVRGVVESDARNRPIRLTGAQVDITDRIVAEQRVKLIIADMDTKIEFLRRQLRSRGR